MPIAEKVERYEVYVGQNNFLPYVKSIRLLLETGGTAFLAFADPLPPNWLQFVGPDQTVVYMTPDEYDQVYRVLQTESPAFFTAIDLFGLQVGAVHTELDLSHGEPTGEGDEDHTQSLEAFLRRAQREAAAEPA